MQMNNVCIYEQLACFIFLLTGLNYGLVMTQGLSMSISSDIMVRKVPHLTLIGIGFDEELTFHHYLQIYKCQNAKLEGLNNYFQIFINKTVCIFVSLFFNFYLLFLLPFILLPYSSVHDFIQVIYPISVLKMDANPIVYLNDGNPMPLIGLGTMNFKPNDKHFNLNDFIMNAAKTGYTHFDINPSTNEQLLGDAFKLVFDSKKPLEDEDGNKIPDQFEPAFPRQKMFLTYKVYNNENIQKSIKLGLQQMKLQYFDLVMLNCPTSPPPAPPEAGGEGGQPKQEPADGQQKSVIKKQSMMVGWKVLQKCKEKGLCKSIGVSNFTIQALLNLFPFVTIKPTVNQIQTHPYLIQKNMVQLCKKLKIVPIAYCPLMRGGKDQKQPLGDKVDYLGEATLKELSVRYAKTIPQVILNYQICRGVAVIAKTQKVDHLHDNFNITDFQLLEQDVVLFESLDKEGKIKVYQLKNLPVWRGEDPLC